jgi:transcriptional regulator with XRE-family HTH domain
MELRVKELREEKGWNQTVLGYHAGLSPSQISLIENGKRNPTAETLLGIARALGVEIGDLFPKAPSRLSPEAPGAGEGHYPDPEDWALPKLISNLATRGEWLEEDMKADTGLPMSEAGMFLEERSALQTMYEYLASQGRNVDSAREPMRRLEKVSARLETLFAQRFEYHDPKQYGALQRFSNKRAENRDRRGGTEGTEEPDIRGEADVS